MAVNIGYDEGGGDDALLVSMQIGTVEKTRKLTTHWKEQLRRARVPYFHSKDFKNFSGGIFKGLDRAQRTGLLSVLGSQIRRRLSVGFTTKVTISEYDSRADNTLKSRWGSAYSFSIQMLLLLARLWLDEHRLGADANIIIEDGHRNSEQALQIIQRGKDSVGEPALNVLSVGLGSKKDHPILQAADMLAYSEWQKIIQGDREIWDALHLKGSRYETAIADLDKELRDKALDYAKMTESIRKQAREAWGKRTKAGV